MQAVLVVVALLLLFKFLLKNTIVFTMALLHYTKYFMMLASIISGINISYGQKKNNSSNKTNTTTKTDNLNKTDALNKKQGLWFYHFKAQMGEPELYEFGSYKDDKKTGVWTKLDKEQMLVATENYTKGVLNGTAQYYESGKLICIGQYRGLNPDYKFDTIVIVNPNSFVDSTVVVPSEIGSTKHGMWRYYDAQSGQMIKEEEYQVDNKIYEKTFQHYTPSDSSHIKKIEANLPHNKNKKPGKSKSLIAY
jgi:antitoxin component YwqK of YwqJK toxin-antitoxin module